MKVNKQDWNKLTQLVIDYTNLFEAPYLFETQQTKNPDVKQLLEKILNYLDKLSEKYGEEVNILATQADYTENIIEKERIFLHAYQMATNDNDDFNKMLISSSLAGLYFELKNREKFEIWIDNLKINLDLYPNNIEQQNYIELCQQAKHLWG